MTITEPPVTLLRGASLFLDFDGTLVEFADQPMDVVVSEQLVALLGRLQRQLDGRVAIVTGRALADIERLLPASTLLVAGGHGAEWRADGQAARWNEPLPEVDELQQRWPGVIVERKAHGLALHYRQAPIASEDCQALAASLAARFGLAVQPGNMVVEVRPAGHDKGTAITRFLDQPPFAGGRPLFIGDDITDEAGFRAARRHGGDGILVGSDRDSAATFRLADVSAVANWLRAASEALDG